MDHAKRLAALLEQENKALRSLDFPTAVALIPEKAAATNSLIERTRAGPISTSEISLWTRLASLASENQTLLERAIEVQTRILLIVGRASVPTKESIQYGTKGQRAPSVKVGALTLSRNA